MIAVAYTFKTPSHGFIQTPMCCFYRSKDSPLINPLTARPSDEVYSRSDKLSYLANYTL